MLGASLGLTGVGLAYSIYSNEQSKKMQRQMAGEQAQEMRRQASMANLEAAAGARTEAATVAASTGGKSGGSTVTGAMLGINSILSRDARSLAEGTASQIAQTNLQTKYNAAAGDTETIGLLVKAGSSVLEKILTKPNNPNLDMKSTVSKYNPNTNYQTQLEIDAALAQGQGF